MNNYYLAYLRKSFYVICAIVLASSAATAKDRTIGQDLSLLKEKAGTFAFAVIGDNRSGDATYKKIMQRIMERKPDFVVNVGDMIAVPGNPSGWRHFREISAPITVPYFLTVGNHDVSDKESEDIYKREVDLPGDKPYYSFECGNSLFIVLDSSLPGQYRKISGEQLAWLQGLLETTHKRHIFVFVHHPLYVERLTLSGSLAGHPKDRDRLQELLTKHKVDAVFAGHLHLYEKKSYNGLTQIITGGAGAPLIADEEHGGFFHFILITVDGERATGEVIDADGKAREKFNLYGGAQE